MAPVSAESGSRYKRSYVKANLGKSLDALQRPENVYEKHDKIVRFRPDDEIIDVEIERNDVM